MAKAKQSASEIDDAATYKVELTRSIPVGRAMVHPGARVRLRGDVLAAAIAANSDAVAVYEKI